MKLKKIDKTPVNGIGLKFTSSGSYRYPTIYRESDGRSIYIGNNRPYMGRLADAYSLFKKVAATCQSLDGVSDRNSMTKRNVDDVRKLGFIFIGGPSGTCVLNDEYLKEYGE